MPYHLPDAIAILERTPTVLDAWLRGLPAGWIDADEGPETFNAFDSVGHLIHGERTDWMVRLGIILEHGEARPFDRYDRFAQRRESAGKSLDDLLDEFAGARRDNLHALRALALTTDDLARRGTHPVLGSVTAMELLAAWVVHDLGHVAQVARVMAKRYATDIGPWVRFLPVVSDRPRPAS